jgi:hypothetical protein
VTDTRFDDFFALFGLKPMNRVPPLRQDIRFDHFFAYTKGSFIRDLARRDVMSLEERINDTWSFTTFIFREHREDQLMLDFHGCLDSESL